MFIIFYFSREPVSNHSIAAMVSSFTEDDLYVVLSEEQMKKSRKCKKSPPEPSYSWFYGILGYDDFLEVILLMFLYFCVFLTIFFVISYVLKWIFYVI